MKIVTTTPTGRVGSGVARLLVRAGVRPTLLVRDGSKLDDELGAASDIVELDQGDAEAVSRACRDADALHWVSPPTEDEDPLDGYDRMGASAARAVTDNGIGHVVFQSSVGAEARGGFGEIDGLARTEEMLNETGASVLHLRCGYFFTNLSMDAETLKTGALTTTLPLDQKLSWVAPRDIGEVTAARLLARDWSGIETQGVLGPEDLSFTEAAAILSRALDRKIEPVRVTDEDVAGALSGMGLGEARVEAIVGMLRGFRGDFEPEDRRDLRSTTPTGLGAWAYSELRPLL